MKPKPLKISNVTLGSKEPAFILGPCVIESEKFVRRMAQRIADICAAESVRFIFKASYDKANRTSVRSFRGIGVKEGCELLTSIGRELNVPVTTDVHSPAEAEVAGEYIDVLQIPAFLCRQTDLLRAAAATGRVVNVKKGQFLAPWDVRNIAEKLAAFGSEKFFFTERGTTFGYNNLVADMRSLYWIREAGIESFSMRLIRCKGRAEQVTARRATACSRRFSHGPRSPRVATEFSWKCTRIRRARSPMDRTRFR